MNPKANEEAKLLFLSPEAYFTVGPLSKNLKAGPDGQ